MSGKTRCCSLCGVSGSSNPTLTYHRFPNPGHSSQTVLRARVWAEHCFPNEDFASVDSLMKLHKSHKILCSRHFDASSYTVGPKIRLNIFSIPSGSTPILNALQNNVAMEREPVVKETSSFEAENKPSFQNQNAPQNGSKKVPVKLQPVIPEGACRLCLHVIKSAPIEIWGNGNTLYAQRILKYCSIRVSREDKLTAICYTCSSNLENIIKFRHLVIKNNTVLRNLNLTKEDDVAASTIDSQKNQENISTNFQQLDHPKPVSETATREFLCPKCPMICYTSSEYIFHSKSHCLRRKKRTNELFTCSFYNCDKSFQEKKALLVHKMSEHPKPKKNLCSFCGLTFKTKYKMNRHTLRVHLEGYKALCPHCGNTFTSCSSIDHQSPCVKKGKIVSCPKCGNIIPKIQLSTHPRMVHNKGKKYSCEICDKEFTYLSNLNVHMHIIHTGEKPYSCPECQFRYKQKATMMRHILKMHNIDMVPLKNT